MIRRISIGGWFYSPVITIGSEFPRDEVNEIADRHSGVFATTSIKQVLSNYHGRVEISKIENGESNPEYVDAQDGARILSLGLEPGNMVKFRFDHEGNKTNKAIKHLTEILSKNYGAEPL